MPPDDVRQYISWGAAVAGAAFGFFRWLESRRLKKRLGNVEADVSRLVDALIERKQPPPALIEEATTSAGRSTPALDEDVAGDQTRLREALADGIARLPEREKLVVTLYYYEELTMRESAEVLGVSESRVSQLHNTATLRLRTRLQHSNDDRP